MKHCVEEEQLTSRNRHGNSKNALAKRIPSLAAN